MIQHLKSSTVSVVVDVSSGIPTILHWGQTLADLPQTWGSFPVTFGAMDSTTPISVVPLHGDAFTGRPGLQGHRRGGRHWSPRFSYLSHEVIDDLHGTLLECVAHDLIAELEIVSCLHLSNDGVLTADRGRAMEQIREGLDREAREYGAQVIDVRIKRADLPEGTPLESAFTRMATARQQEAATIRAQGQKQAQIIRATAEATAAKTYADAFNKDPAFYDFYRAMQSYDATFAQKGSSTSIVLSPDNEYLRQFKGK